jgi:hypothetical protein
MNERLLRHCVPRNDNTGVIASNLPVITIYLSCHCEERSDAAISSFVIAITFLAMTKRRYLGT